jgi:saccharopine dehydrogenase (NAD+, L-lysine-forming)
MVTKCQGFPSEDQFPLRHQHICFSYAYKQQSGWKELLNRFVDGGGKLLDIEYLVDSQGKRLATFTRTAGYIGKER